MKLRQANPLSEQTFDALLDRLGNADYVLIGEGSHGTDEFYRLCAHLTAHLIAEKDFNGVVAEADFPDAYRVNRYVRGASNDANAENALGNFKRFPTWAMPAQQRSASAGSLT